MRGIRVIIAGGKIPSTLQLHNLLDSLGYDAVVTENGEQALAIKFQKSDQIATAKLSRFITTELSKDLPRGESVILNNA